MEEDYESGDFIPGNPKIKVLEDGIEEYYGEDAVDIVLCPCPLSGQRQNKEG